jgi:hypothetical protein
MIDIKAKILQGDYETKTSYPTKPVMPAALKKNAGDLTTEEAATLPQVIAQWNEDKETNKKLLNKYYKERIECKKRLINDVFVYVGKGHLIPNLTRMHEDRKSNKELDKCLKLWELSVKERADYSEAIDFFEELLSIVYD